MLMFEASLWTTLVAAVIILALDLWAIVSVMRSPGGSGGKFLWVLLIVLLPVVGLVIWGVAGPRGVAVAPTSREHSKG